jgi:rod shape-determining protein MreC
MAVFHLAIRPPSNLTRLVLLVTLSAALMVLDHRGQHLARIRSALMVLTYPIQLVAAVPARVGAGVSAVFRGREDLAEKVDALTAERLQLMGRLQQLESMEAENERLRRMLAASQRVAERVLAAELLEVSSAPFSRKIMIGRGKKDGVYIRQPIIDAYGIMGQVTQVGPHISRATLITDPGHAIPILVSRNGLRAIAFGTGEADNLAIRYLTPGADIREGDLLVTSGMGGTFPPRYPVARVEKINSDPNEAFIEVRAKPAAQLDASKQVLLIWHTPPDGTTPLKTGSLEERG